jgi:hypothetical protein
MSDLTLEELKAHANPSNWEVREQYIATEVTEDVPPITIQTPMIRAHNRILRKSVDIPTSDFNNFFINTQGITDKVEVKFSIDGTVKSVAVGAAVLYED